MTLKLEIVKDMTLLELEELLSNASRSRERAANLWLATEIGSQFFKETHIASVVASLAARHDLSVTDWYGIPDLHRAGKRFSETVEGLTCLVYAREILDAKRKKQELNVKQLIRTIVEREGIAEPPIESPRIDRAELPRLSGTSLTFCAFDPEYPIPISLDVRHQKEAFKDEFIAYRRRYFEKGVAEGFSDFLGPERDYALASFVFEIYKNTFEHGRLNPSGGTIPGLRYIRIRKHKVDNESDLLKRSAGFVELELFVKRAINAEILPRKKRQVSLPTFYEISISDHGLGIVDRFLATRPDFESEADTIEKRVALINRIIDEALSSKQTQSGAGHGLEWALSAVANLKGFVMLRTDRLWLYSNFAADKERTGKTSLRPVSTTFNLAPMVGTHFNLIFPLEVHAPSLFQVQD